MAPIFSDRAREAAASPGPPVMAMPWPRAEMIAANQWAPIMQVVKLANFDDDKGYVVGEGPVTPGPDAIQNRLL